MTLLVTLFVVRLVLQMLEPYALHIVLAVIAFLMIGKTWARFRRW